MPFLSILGFLGHLLSSGAFGSQDPKLLLLSQQARGSSLQGRRKELYSVEEESKQRGREINTFLLLRQKEETELIPGSRRLTDVFMYRLQASQKARRNLLEIRQSLRSDTNVGTLMFHPGSQRSGLACNLILDNNKTERERKKMNPEQLIENTMYLN